MSLHKLWLLNRTYISAIFHLFTCSGNPLTHWPYVIYRIQKAFRKPIWALCPAQIPWFIITNCPISTSRSGYPAWHIQISNGLVIYPINIPLYPKYLQNSFLKLRKKPLLVKFPLFVGIPTNTPYGSIWLILFHNIPLYPMITPIVISHQAITGISMDIPPFFGQRDMTHTPIHPDVEMSSRATPLMSMTDILVLSQLAAITWQLWGPTRSG